ncbi:MAG: nickel/cobalt transporter [Euzebya sp.]
MSISSRRTALPLTLTLLGLILALMVMRAPAAMAHPLGNFTTNTSATILPADPQTQVVYVLDLAEIPTQQTGSDIDEAGGPQGWAQQECVRIAAAQSLDINEQARELTAQAAAITFPDGQAGLKTLRLTCSLTAQTAGLANPSALTYTDDYTSGRIGWREIIAAPNNSTIVSADVPSVSSTDQLRTYETTQIMRVTTAEVTFDPTAGPAPQDFVRSTELEPVAARPGGLEGLVESYTDLISRQTLTPAFVLLAFVLAIALGTAHAIAPGHGKTVIAAYLLGEGGQASQAVALGGTVAITHTIGVLILGLIVQTSTSLAPESLYPLLGVMGGVIFTGLGVVLLYRAIVRRGHTHDHDHPHDHDHDHGPAAPTDFDHGPTSTAEDVLTALDHDHGPTAVLVAERAHDHDHDREHSPTRSQPPQTTWRMLILPGLAGGMVPSPSALLVLLGGIALGRTWFGVLLVLAYGIGMALALVGVGYLLHRVRFRVMDRLESTTWARVSVALPIVTSTLIILGGLVIVGRTLLTA